MEKLLRRAAEGLLDSAGASIADQKPLTMENIDNIIERLGPADHHLADGDLVSH